MNMVGQHACKLARKNKEIQQNFEAYFVQILVLEYWLVISLLSKAIIPHHPS
jgi:hypothetical protein